jgi:hypothetical protein
VQAALGAGLHLRRDVLAPVAAHLPGALEGFRVCYEQPDGLGTAQHRQHVRFKPSAVQVHNERIMTGSALVRCSLVAWIGMDTHMTSGC